MLSHRYDDALVFAAKAHRTQTRKASQIPYIAHLLSVSALVIEQGGSEDCAIAALLHDAVEDQGGLGMADRIEAAFGPIVRRIVMECSDREDDCDTPWQVRKDRYIAHITDKSPEAILVTTADKLHNATAILNDLRQMGPAVFDRFTAGRDGTLWYYRALADALSLRAPDALGDRLDAVVRTIEAEVSSIG